MTLMRKDMTPVYKAAIAKGSNAARWQRAAYVDLLPPCGDASPAGLNIQAWLALAQAARHEDASRKDMEDNPLPETRGRACHRPCESTCNRQFLDPPIERGSPRARAPMWTCPVILLPSSRCTGPALSRHDFSTRF
jgi:hypothetical protein